MSNDSENKQNDKFLEGVNYVEHLKLKGVH